MPRIDPLPLFKLTEQKCQEDGVPFAVEFEVIPTIDFADTRQMEIWRGITATEERLSANQQRIDVLNQEIATLTNQADGLDYAIAVTCGVITGIIDSIFVGQWDFASAKADANKAINEKVEDFAKKDPEYKEFLARKRGDKKHVSSLDSAIEFLEKKYKLPGDGEYKSLKNEGITDKTHHLDDFCHHPTLIGLICCVVVQFTGTAKYRSNTGKKFPVPVEVNEYGKFVSEDKWGKVLAGVINWFFNVAETIKNRRGHLMSDIAGSSSSVGKGNEGAGLPGSFLSLAKELSALPCFKEGDFAENLRKAYQNGIGDGKSQLDLGIFNGLFEGASSKLDMRTEMAVGHELKRQALPVIINEVLVRGTYFIRRFINELKKPGGWKDFSWKEVLPLKNRTIVRMLTIATGTFTAVDLADAAIRTATDPKTSGAATNPATFAATMALRVNFVGIGRFAIAIATDASMGVKKVIKENELMNVMSEQLMLRGAVVFYKEADMWIAAENAQKAIAQLYQKMEDTTTYVVVAIQDMSKSLNQIDSDIAVLNDENPDFVSEMLYEMEWG